LHIPLKIDTINHMREATGTITSMRLADGLIQFEIDRSDGKVELVEAADAIAATKALISALGRACNIIGKRVKYGVMSGKLQFLAIQPEIS
jgi:hypothetical protein